MWHSCKSRSCCLFALVLLTDTCRFCLQQNKSFLQCLACHTVMFLSSAAPTYLLQLLPPRVGLRRIRVVSDQLPQRALQLLHLPRMLSQLWKQSLEKRKKKKKDCDSEQRLENIPFIKKHKILLPCSPEPEHVPPPVWRGRPSVPVSGFALCLSASSSGPLCSAGPSASAPARPADDPDAPSTPHPEYHIDCSRQTQLPAALSGLRAQEEKKEKFSKTKIKN